MRTSIIFFLIAGLLFFAKSVMAQVSAGTLKIQNYGTHYRILIDQLPVNNTYPKPDSVSLRVTVICPTTMAYQVNNIPIGGVLDYKLGGTNYIAASVIWWRNGVKKSQTSMPTTCGFYTNPIDCFLKL